MNRAGPIKRSAMKPYRPTVTGDERTSRALVYARSGGWCETRIDTFCRGLATNWHHRQNRSQGGAWVASNGLHVCGSGTQGCHGVLTNTNGLRTQYEQNGWIVPRGLLAADVPTLIYTATLGHTYVLLDDDGCIELAPWPEPVPGDPFELPLPLRRDDSAGAA